MRRLSKKAVLARASEIFNVPSGVITGDGRSARIFRPRAAICLVLHEAGYSYPAIGFFLNRDHTSTMHAVRRAYQMIETDEDFRDDTLRLRVSMGRAEHADELLQLRADLDAARKQIDTLTGQLSYWRGVAEDLRASPRVINDSALGQTGQPNSVRVSREGAKGVGWPL